MTRQMWRYIAQDALIFVALVALVVGSVALGIPPAVRDVLIPSAGTLGLFLICMMVLYAVNTRKALRQRHGILAQSPVATWRLSADEWAQFGRLDLARQVLAEQIKQWQPSLTRNAMMVGMAMFVILSLLNMQKGAIGFLGALLVALGMFALVLRSAYRVRRSLSHPFGMVVEPPDVVITAGGAVIGEQAIVFQQPRMTIQKAYIIPTEPSLLRIDLSYAMAKQRLLPYTLMIPISAGHEPDAERVVSFLRTTFGAA